MIPVYRRLIDVLKPILYVVVPAVVLHELTHAAAALAVGADDVTVRWRVPAADIVWSAETPLSRVRFAHLAPTVAGLLIGGTALTAAYAAGLSVTLSPVTILVVGTNYALYTWPTRADLNPLGTQM